ncbi:MAG: L-aspartate oxidase [Propionibacteriaceae bacterium]|nr:L-aspartate oxidase [Micropruina sp.]HBX82001.1 L-aspartate oxidase [Propionibacteriaceae bacterium]
MAHAKVTTIQANGPIIIGAGLAGLVTAIELSPKPCVVLSAGAVKTGTSTGWAQGGVAAVEGPDDSFELHIADTLSAGAGLCDPDVVARIISDAPEAIDWMASIGTRFDRNPDGTFVLGLEGAHSRRRIVHAQGDGTGAELLRAVVEKARTLPSISLWDYSPAVELLTQNGRVSGVVVDRAEGRVELLSDIVVLATGGVGGLFQHTTNPLSSRGQGLSLAARAGAVLRDLEMVQFHPTGLDVGIDPMPLVSEAVRGEGALVIDETGARVLENPLAARDVVSRAEWASLQAGHHVFVDAREHPGPAFPKKFPQIFDICLRAKLDPRESVLPVHPAAHYHMGGVQVDLLGRSSVPGLYAVGEVASTGLHGANRLASNSLLEAMVCGRWTGDHLAQIVKDGIPAPEPSDANPVDGTWTPDPNLQTIRAIVSEHLGVLRDAKGIQAAIEALGGYLDSEDGRTAMLIAVSALRREECRGGHWRTDYPDERPLKHTLVTISDLPLRSVA